jgi:hypothetical protein
VRKPRQVLAASGYLWVSAFGDGSVVEVDPRTERLRRQRKVDVAEAGNGIWISSPNEAGIYRIPSS